MVVFLFSATFDAMRKFLLPLTLLVALACDDGNLQIAEINFDAAAIEFCDSPLTTETTLFFKLTGSEALVLELQSGLLQPEETSEPLRSAIPGQSTVTYRTFTDAINKSYFCASIPPGEPDIVLDVTAAAGEVLITTLRNETDTTLFEHTISIQDLSLVTDNGERISDLTTIEFGTISISDQ